MHRGYEVSTAGATCEPSPVHKQTTVKPCLSCDRARCTGEKKKKPSRHFLPVLHVLSVERDVREHSLKIMLQLRVLTHPRWPYRAISSLQTKAGCTARFIVYIISLKEKKKLSFEPFVCFNLIPPPTHTHQVPFFFQNASSQLCFCLFLYCT